MLRITPQNNPFNNIFYHKIPQTTNKILIFSPQLRKNARIHQSPSLHPGQHSQYPQHSCPIPTRDEITNKCYFNRTCSCRFSSHGWLHALCLSSVHMETAQLHKRATTNLQLGVVYRISFVVFPRLSHSFNFPNGDTRNMAIYSSCIPTKEQSMVRN